MTQLLAHASHQPTTETIPQDGPVLLATKQLTSENASTSAPLAMARWLAAREARALHVVAVEDEDHVLSAVAGMTPLPPELNTAERHVWADKLRRILQHSGEGTSEHVQVLSGPTARTIVAAARDCAARMIVIGTGVHGHVGRHVFGERALQILSLADRPVLIVPPGARAGQLSSAIVAVDFSAACLRAASAALPMMSVGGRLTLLHVKVGDPLNDTMVGWPDAEYAQHCKQRFVEFIGLLPMLPGVIVETLCLHGDPADVIAHHASSSAAGLIACGRLGHAFVERLFVRSTSSDLVRRATCPVLIAPELPADIRVENARS
jgi:nucleotide-binding universal stress UspA family protein